MTKPDISREAVERLARQVEFRLNHQLGATGATNTMILALRALRDELDRMTARAEAAEARVAEVTDERYRLAYAICGGEDAPGLLDSTSVEHLERISAQSHSSHMETIDRLMGAEARGFAQGIDAAANTCVLSGQDLAEGDWGPEGRDMAVMLENRILALTPPADAQADPVGEAVLRLQRDIWSCGTEWVRLKDVLRALAGEQP